MKRKILLCMLLWGVTLPISRAEENRDYLLVHPVGEGNIKSMLLERVERILFTEEELVLELVDNSTASVFYNDFSKLTFGGAPSSIEELPVPATLSITYRPADKLVAVMAAQPLASVQVYNMQGHLVQQIAPQVEAVTLSMDNSPAGVYIVLARTREITKTEKIIIY